MTMAVMTVFMVASVAALFYMRASLIGRDLGTNNLLVVVGIALVAGGLNIHRKRKRYLTARILVGIPEVHGDEKERGKLLDQGPYGIIRHPRYVEILLLTFGYAAISNHVGAYVLSGLAVPIVHLLVLLEERELLDRFGEAYREYRERVPRYIPAAGFWGREEYRQG